MPQVKRNNPNAIKTLAFSLRELENLQTKVGWFSTSKYKDGTPVAYVAAIQELGSTARGIPPRPFMRPTAMKYENEWRQIAADGARAVLKGNASGYAVMEALGLKAEGDIAKTISEVYTPELSPVTIELRAMKKKNPTLQITGKIVGEAAAKTHQSGYQQPAGVSTKPLVDSGYMVATVTSITEKTS